MSRTTLYRSVSTNATATERGRDGTTRATIDVTDATLAEVRAFARRRDRSVYLERRGGRTRLVAVPVR